MEAATTAIQAIVHAEFCLLTHCTQYNRLLCQSKMQHTKQQAMCQEALTALILLIIIAVAFSGYIVICDI